MRFLTDLSNDLFLDIFDYLDVWHIFRAFFNLNQRFNRLICDRRILFQANLLSINFEQFSIYQTRILPRIASFIRYLIISDQENYLQKILRSFSLNNLISVKLYHVKFNQLINILNNCQLKSIVIDTKDIQNEKHLNELCRMLFCQQADLKVLQVNFHTHLFFRDQRFQTNQLRRITIQCPCFSSDIIVLISQLPKLCYLNAWINDYNREFMDKDIDYISGNESIRSVILQIENMPYDRLVLLLKLMSHVQILELNGKIDFDINDVLEFRRNYRIFRCHLQYNLIY